MSPTDDRKKKHPAVSPNVPLSQKIKANAITASAFAAAKEKSDRSPIAFEA
jgi:hypothetical protein